MTIPKPTIEQKRLIRIETPSGNLLFTVNELTREIEYIPVRRGSDRARKKYYIPMDVLRALCSNNVIAENPVRVYKVTKVEPLNDARNGKNGS